jgi:hypothetical protein
MNIDDRLEALAQSLELLAGMHRDHETRVADEMAHIREGLAQVNVTLGRLAEAQVENEKRFLALAEANRELADAQLAADKRLARQEEATLNLQMAMERMNASMSRLIDGELYLQKVVAVHEQRLNDFEA